MVHGDDGAAAADAFVFFGATGDLAHKKIFPALYRMVQRHTLTVPVIGVAYAHWDVARLREHVRDSIAHTEGGIDDPATLDRLLSLLDYVDRDYADPATFQALSRVRADARRPAHYLAIPPALFATVIAGLGAAGLGRGARVVVEKPFGRDLASARALNQTVRSVLPDEAIFRIEQPGLVRTRLRRYLAAGPAVAILWTP